MIGGDRAGSQWIREPLEGIRATVIGAGAYTVQASGTTSYISNPRVLPVFSLKVVRAALKPEQPVIEALQQVLAKFDLPCLTSGLALSLQFHGQAEKVKDRAKDQIEYPDEDPFIRQKFEAELARRGVQSLMPDEAYSNRNYAWSKAMGKGAR